MASAADRHGHSRAETEWQHALELEKKLRATYRKKSFYDPEARALRSQLRGSYESLLFHDAGFAAANDVEVALWRAVFYRPIEEFRSRMKQAEKAGEVGAAQLPKVATAFTKFLEEASIFYRRLVMQLQAAYGDVGIKLEVPKPTSGSGAANGGGAAATAAMHSSAGSSAPRDVRPSIHRCLIYLGDLSRYTAQAAPKAAAAAPSVPQQQPAARQDWHKAAHYYRLAARVLPRSGNPHNQLAVMAVMMGDELRAVYHYARSLCVGIPFQTAKENLMLLFEQNRHRYAEYVQQKQQRPQQQLRQLPPAKLLADVSVCYVRLAGLFFDKINQHEYPDVSENAVAALAALTGPQALMDIMQRQPRADCTPLHLTVLGIFAVHNCNPASTDGRTAAVGPGDAAQRVKQRSRALTTLFKTGRLLCQAASTACNAVAASAADTSALSGPGHLTTAAGQEWKAVACLLVAVNVLFHWLAAHPTSSGVQVNAATEDEVKARATFWSAAAQLLTAAVRAYPYSRPSAAAATIGSPQSLTSSGGMRQDSDGADACYGGALPEELELLGFEPLRSKHYSHVTDVGKLAVDEPATRTCRLLAAAKVISVHISAPEQQQAMKQYSSASSGQVQVQTMKQLAAGIQHFVAAVAGEQPAAVSGGGNADNQVDAMDVDAQPQQQLSPQQQQRQDLHQHGVEGEVEEEVIVFKPRVNRLSTLSDDSATAVAAVSAGVPAASPTAQAPVRVSPPRTLPVRTPPSMAAAAAAEPPPMPQQLLASRQQGRASGSSSQVASGVSSPSGAASPQRLAVQPQQLPQQQPPQQRQQQPHPDIQPMLTSPADNAAAGLHPDTPLVVPPHAAGLGVGMGGSGGNLAAAGLLHGHAATALDLQQGQAASDALLARLTSRQGGIGSSSSGLGTAGFGGVGVAGGLGIGLSSNLPPAPGYGGLSAGASGGLAAAGGSGGFSRAAVGGPAAGATAAAGSYFAGLRSQPPSPAVFGSTAAAAALTGSAAVCGYMGSPRFASGLAPALQQQQQQFDQLFGNLPAGAFTGAQHSRGSSVDTLGLGLGMQGLGQPAAGDGFEGFDPLGFGLNSALNSQVFAGGGVEGLSTAAGGIAFDDQLLLDLGSGLGSDVLGVSSALHSQQRQQQQQYADNSAAYQLEQTARAAADCILSPEHKQGPMFMQRHQQQQMQLQQQQAAVTAQPALAEAAAAANAADVVAAGALAVAAELQGSTGLQGVSQQLQQQQQRRLSDGQYSPSFQQAIGFERSSIKQQQQQQQQQQHVQQQQQSPLGRISAPSMALPGGSMVITAAARGAAASSAPNSPSVLTSAGGSEGYAMFAGRDLFASADVPVLSAAAVQERQQRISGSNITGPQPPHQAAATDPDPVSCSLQLQQQQQQVQQLRQQQQGLPGLRGCDSPTSPNGLTLLDFLAQQQRTGQVATQAAAGCGEVVHVGSGDTRMGLYSNGAEVLLPPLDVVQSQNPFAA